MTRSHKRGLELNPNAIDQLLERLRRAARSGANEGAGGMPLKLDVEKLAEGMGVSVSRGEGTSAFSAIVIPSFYSDREARLAIARQLAKVTIEQVGSECKVTDQGHDCPSEELCEFVEIARRSPKTLDIIAAAMLMPTEDFAKWAEILGNEEGALASSYAVPRSLARVRLDTLRLAKESTQH